jgi:RNA polymerase sigma-70 factor (ECF subfamily)
MARNWKTILDHTKGVLMRRGRTVHEAEDLVQDAYVRMARFEMKEAVIEPEAFLMHAALNLSKDAYRANTHHGEQLVLEDAVLVDPAPSVEDALLDRERIERLSECLAALPSRTREIFLAHRRDGLRYHEIARVHGLSVSAVEKHIAKAVSLVTHGMEGWYP